VLDCICASEKNDQREACFVIVITGPGRSGTSFLATLYRELGFDPGGRWNLPGNAGGEATRFIQINRKLSASLGTALAERRGGKSLQTLDRLNAQRVPDPARKHVDSVLTNLRYRGNSLDLLDWDKLDAVVAEYGDTLRRISAQTQVVKDPRFCWTLQAWLASGVSISALVLALRPLEAMAESRVRAGMIPEEGRTWAKNHFAYGIGLLMSAATEYRVPVVVVRFPDFLDDPRDLYERLPFPEERTWEDFDAAFARSHDASLVHDRR
jgi:hypothetical protein